MLTMFFCNANQLIVYLEVIGLIACYDLRYESDKYDVIGSLTHLKRLGPKKMKDRLLTKCLGRQGVCMPSRVCPWERLLEDRSDACMVAEGRDSICCKVSRVRMISDFFLLY